MKDVRAARNVGLGLNYGSRIQILKRSPARYGRKAQLPVSTIVNTTKVCWCIMFRIGVVYRTVLLAVFALWFGGFTFYTAFVVPTGTEVLGSGRAQGMITQQVTNQLNLIGGFMVALLIVDFSLGWPRRSKRVSLLMGLLTGGISILWLIILWLHLTLDGMIINHEQISDEIEFYQTHRIYLWTSTVQWVLCWIWLLAIVSDWFPPTRKRMARVARNRQPGS